MGYGPWDREQSDPTEQLTHTHTHTKTNLCVCVCVCVCVLCMPWRWIYLFTFLRKTKSQEWLFSLSLTALILAANYILSTPQAKQIAVSFVFQAPSRDLGI